MNITDSYRLKHKTLSQLGVNDIVTVLGYNNSLVVKILGLAPIGEQFYVSYIGRNKCKFYNRQKELCNDCPVDHMNICLRDYRDNEYSSCFYKLGDKYGLRL
jgi:hypothetical protein